MSDKDIMEELEQLNGEGPEDVADVEEVEY